jgi:hypothetical protein
MNTHNDASSREKRDDKPLPLPGIESARARRVRRDPPHRFFAEGREYFESDVIEIEVEMDGEFPIAGIGPALFVGNVPIIDGERIGDRRYRFFAPGSTRLARNATVALGRAGTGIPRPEKKSRVRLEWPDGMPR